VAVVGCSGSGKTVLARRLARAIGAPHIELDAIYHQPGWTALEDQEYRRQVEAAVDAPRWVVDGNYSVVQDIVWSRADTVVWFDLSLARVMCRVVRRTVRRSVMRTELWNGNREPLSNLVSFNPEKSIIAWAARRHGLYHRRYLAAEEDPRWDGLTFVRLRSPAAARQLLGRLSTATVDGHVERGAG
jgi:hypothetical protein